MFPNGLSFRVKTLEVAQLTLRKGMKKGKKLCERGDSTSERSQNTGNSILCYSFDRKFQFL